MESIMDSLKFNEILGSRISKITEVLGKKAAEYARGDRLHNFKAAARMGNTTPEDALLGMWRKHLISVFDIIEDTKKGIDPTEYLIDEKIGDSINYLILLEALMRERIS
jgi:hypothetical protein